MQLKVGTKEASLAVIFTALVTLATSSFSLYIPATRGFFNLGEVMVYTSALIGGPIVGFIAGGLGSALADLLLGYTQFAPGTFVIKGVEGFIVGLYALVERSVTVSKRVSRGLALILVILLSSLVYLIGVSSYTGRAEIAIAMLEGPVVIEFTKEHWVIISILILAVVGGTVMLASGKPWLMVLAILAGGLEMVLGYYLYETLVLGLTPENALVEVPFNLMQMLIGITVAIPLYHSVRRVYPRV